MRIGLVIFCLVVLLSSEAIRRLRGLGWNFDRNRIAYDYGEFASVTE